jgi:hypothetical protein
MTATFAAVAELQDVSQLRTEPQPVVSDGGVFRFEVTMPPQSTAAVRLVY